MLTSMAGTTHFITSVIDLFDISMLDLEKTDYYLNDVFDISTVGPENTNNYLDEMFDFITNYLNPMAENHEAFLSRYRCTISFKDSNVVEFPDIIKPLRFYGKKPKKHIKPNNKLANKITKGILNIGEVDLRVSSNKARKEIITTVMMTYEGENLSFEGRTKFTPYDREVHDSVVSLSVAGNEIFTPDIVFRAMNGMTGCEKVSEQAIEAITRSVDKSRFITLKIDFSREAQAYRKDCKAIYEGYLLACDKVTVYTGGHTKEAYKLLRKPILYEYSQLSGQILSIPIELLQTKESVRNTEDVIVIRGYLIRQIEGMKSRKFKRSPNILYEKIYDELDVSPENFINYKEKTRKIRGHVEAILNGWVNLKYIKSYEKYMDGKTIKGVCVEI